MDGMQGHDEPCYYCGEPCSSLAGSPSRWPLPLCHRDDPGKVKWHHTGCVTDRLIENGGHERARELQIESAALLNFIIRNGLYERWTASREDELSKLSA